MLSAKFRSKLVFLKKKFLIWSKEEIESEEGWKNFIDNESWKIWENTNAYEAQFVMSGSKQEMDLIIVTKEKICKIRFCQNIGKVYKESKTFNSRLVNIYEMMHGKKFGKGKPKFMFGQKPKESENPEA